MIVGDTGNELIRELKILNKTLKEHVEVMKGLELAIYTFVDKKEKDG